MYLHLLNLSSSLNPHTTPALFMIIWCGKWTTWIIEKPPSTGLGPTSLTSGDPFTGFFTAVSVCVCVCCAFKGIVHPKMKILSSFTHPQVVPDLYECLCSAEHKGRYSEECGKQSSSGAPLTSIVFFFLLWKSMVSQNSLVTNFLQNIFLCGQQNKEIHTGLELLEGE